MTLQVLSPPELRRRSRYLPIARRTTVAYAARCNSDSFDIFPFWLLLRSRKGIQLPHHRSMPRHRDACGMQSSSAFPIGQHHPDLVWPQHSRSCLLSASAVTRPDHVQHPYHYCREGGGFLRSFDYVYHSGSYSDLARDRLPAPAPGAGLRSYLQIDSLAAHPGSYFSRAGQALGAGDRLARGGDQRLDRTARPTWVNGMAMSGDRFGSQLQRRSRSTGLEPIRHLFRA